MFASNSRYYSLPTYKVTRADGSQVVVVESHMPNPLKLAGYPIFTDWATGSE